MTPREKAEEIVRKFVDRRASLSKAPATADEITNVAILGSAIEQAITAAVEEEREAIARMVELPTFIGLDDLAKCIRARCNAYATERNNVDSEIG